MPFIGNAGQFSNIYEKNYETTTLYVVEGDAVYQAYNPDDSHYKLITNLQEITDIGNVTSNTVQFSNAITGFTTTSNVGVANSTPVHTLDIGSNVFIDDVGQKKISTTGTIHADEYTGSTITVTDSVTTRDLIADRVFPKTNGFMQFTSNVGIINNAPTHTLDIGANVQIDEYGSNTFWTSGNVYSEHYKGSNVTVTGSMDSEVVIVNRLHSKDADFIHATSNVGILNTAPTHTLDIGANVQIDEYGSNTFWTSGNVYANIYTGTEIQLSGVIRATDFILTGGSQATPTPDLQTISEVLAPGGSTPFSSDRTMTLSNTTTALDATIIQALTVNSNLIGNNVTAVTVNSNIIGNNVTAVTVNSNLIGNNVTAVTVSSNLIGNNVTAVTVSSNLIGNNVNAVTVNSNLVGNNVSAVTVNSNLVGNNVSAVTVNSNLIGNNVTAITVNSNLIGNNVTVVTVNSNLIGNNVTALTVNSNLIGNNVTAVTVNSNLIGNNVTAVTVNSNLIGNNVSASFISGNGDLIFRKYTLGINGISAYTVIGPGFTSPTNDPTLTLIRGQIYVFDNTTYYTSHPFKIRTSSNGTDYTTGVVDDGAGTTTFTVPMNAPIKLYYQCENHADMGNTIYIPLENLDTSQTLNLSNDLVVDTDKLIVDVSEGKVGINKSVPTKALDVTGEIACSSDLTVGGDVIATGTVSGSSSLTPGDYLTGSAYTGASNQTFAVDATSANTASKVVARDASGNFSAGTITAALSTSLSPGTYLTGTAYNGSTARTFAVDATSANTASKVVARDASGNFSAGTITADLSGNASTATTLATARTINGVSFNGSANIQVNPYINNDDTGDTNCPILFSANTTAGYKAIYEDSALYFDNTNNKLYCPTFDGNLSGNQSGGTVSATTGVFSTSLTAESTSGNITILAKAPDNKVATLAAYGTAQGTGRLFVGQESAYGGGIEYNGDNSPTSTGAGQDYITMYRVDNGAYNWTARNFYNSNNWEFRGTVTAPTFSGALSGNASTATTLQTTRTINGVDFNGSGDIIVEPYISNDDTGDANCPIVFTQNTTAGYKRLYEDSALFFDNTNNRLYSTQMSLGDYLYHTSDTNTYFGFPANDTINFATSNAERMRIDSNGNVGVGTVSPAAQLQLYGAGQTSETTFDQDGSTGGLIALKSSDDSTGSGGGIMFGANQGYFAAIKGTLEDGSDNTRGRLTFFTRTLTGDATMSHAMTIADGGNVGIGTTNPQVKLHVVGAGAGLLGYDDARYFSWSVGLTSTAPYGTTWNGISIYATNDIVTKGYLVSHDGFFQASDTRIKKNIIDADDAECLETLRLIKPKKYQYKDEISRGQEPVWGFIAQEVRDTLPYATELRRDVLPNIYELANVSQSNVITFVNFNTSNLESNATTLIRTNGIDGEDHDVHLAEVIDEHTIRVEEDLSAWIGSLDESGNVVSGNQLFVYGQEVDDFVFLKKESIWTVATSALQEIDRQQQADKLRIAELEKQLASVLERLDA